MEQVRKMIAERNQISEKINECEKKVDILLDKQNELDLSVEEEGELFDELEEQIDDIEEQYNVEGLKNQMNELTIDITQYVLDNEIDTGYTKPIDTFLPTARDFVKYLTEMEA